MKYYTVYETKNKKNGKTYRGKHITDNPYDGYIGSGKILKLAIKKYGIESFEKFVLFIFDNKKDMNDKEMELVNDDYLKSGKTYNLKLGGQGGWDYANKPSKKMYSDRLRASIIATNKLKYLIKNDVNVRKHYQIIGSNNWKQAHKNGKIKYDNFKGKHHTIETKRKIGEKNSFHQQGKKNSQYGTCWIFNDKESIKIKKENLDEFLIQGWNKGRRCRFESY